MADDKLAGSPAPNEIETEFAPDPRNVRLLKWAVIAMGVLLLAGTIVVGVTIVKRAGNLADRRAGFGDIDVNLSAGQTVEGMALDGDRLAVRTAEEVIIINVRRGYIQGRIKLNQNRPSSDGQP